MFEFKRLFDPASRQRAGAASADEAILELLDVVLLRAQAQSADIQYARTTGGDRNQLRLRQACVYRDIARRTGDALALRRAASTAERAALDAKPAQAAQARFEQARCGMLGAELFGGEGLYAAADRVLIQAADGPDVIVAASALAKRAKIAATQALDRGAPLDALAALTGYDDPFNILRAKTNAAAGRLPLAKARIERACATVQTASALKNDGLIARGAADLGEVMQEIDAAYHPLTWSRAAVARADALRRLGQLKADTGTLSEAVEGLSRVFDTLLRDHSPLDWALAQAAHGEALWALAETSGLEAAWVRAGGAFDRAWGVVRAEPALMARALVGERRGALAVRTAVINEDSNELDAVEAGFRCELAAVDPHRDPVGWALSQLNLGRVYLAREAVRPLTRADRARAGLALAEAGEVFAEQGLGVIAKTARDSLPV